MSIDLSSLSRGAHGETLRVAGVRVGDLVTDVDRLQVTAAEEREPRENREQRGGVWYRKQPDGTSVVISLAEQVAAVVRRGGKLWCGPVMLRVHDGRIDRIFVRGPALASLEIACEADIAARLGAAAGREHTLLGWRQHHYPDRGFVIAWHEREARLELVQLGADPWDEPRLGAKDLLSDLIHGPEALFAQNIDEAALSRAALVRRQRLETFVRVLELGSTAAVWNGEFLRRDLDPARRAALEEIAARSPWRDPPDDDDAGCTRSAPTLFRHLLSYRRDVLRVVRATAGWLECSDPILLGMIAVQNELGAKLEVTMVDIDRWLCTLLGPAQRTFAVRDLIAFHGWPNVSLEQLELDEM